VDFASANEQFQELHTAVTHAAFLAICMRLSPTIFHIYFEQPGGDFKEDKFNLNHEAYLASKAAVEATVEKTLQGNAYGPLIKFVGWPSVKRYKPGSGVVGGEKMGQRIYNISKCGVIYYWGLQDRRQGDRMGLQDFIDSKKSGKGWLFGW
jgi:hypothetical protein